MGFLNRVFGKKTTVKKKEAIKKDSFPAPPKKKLYATVKGREDTQKKSEMIAKREKPEQKKKASSFLKGKKDIQDAYRYIYGMMVNEKATDMSAEKKYCFRISKNATKKNIRRAIYNLYGEYPLKVQTISLPSKPRRYGRSFGYTSSERKCVVTMKKKLDIYGA